MAAKYPVIGLSIQPEEGGQKIYQSYIDAIYHAGAIPLLLPLPDIKLRAACDTLAALALERVDGLLLTGGGDVDARIYGEWNYPYNGGFREERDLFEIALAKRASGRKKPILGICRGIQTLNVALGGTLYQDIHAQNEGVKLIAHSQKAPDYSTSHEIDLDRGSRIARVLVPAGEEGDAPADFNDAGSYKRVLQWAEAFAKNPEAALKAGAAETSAAGDDDGEGGGAAGGCGVGGDAGASLAVVDSADRALVGLGVATQTISVNSFHHQAVKDVAPGMVVTARAPDGIVEAIEPSDDVTGSSLHAFTIGVQWHPERLWRHYRSAARLFRLFALACAGAPVFRAP